MKLLFDPQIFLLFISGNWRLSTSWRDSIVDPDNQVYLSVVSLWESIIKYRLGKLPLPESPDIYLPKQRKNNHIDSLEVDEERVLRLAQLPVLHRDPFDRLLICQALQHNLIIVTVDTAIKAYSVPQLSA